MSPNLGTILLHCRVREIIQILSPLTGVIPKSDRCLLGRFWAQFPLSKCDKYMHNIYLIKSYPYMVDMISDFKIRMIFYKFVPINFIDAIQLL